MDPFAPTLTTSRLARALGIDRRQFQALRAAGHPAHRIPPTRAGRAPDGARWSAFDAVRFAVLGRLAPPRKRAILQLPLSRRREVFEALDDAALERAARGAPCWLVVPTERSPAGARIVSGSLPDPRGDSVTVVVDVTALAGRMLLRLQLLAEDDGKSGRGGRI